MGSGDGISVKNADLTPIYEKQSDRIDIKIVLR